MGVLVNFLNNKNQLKKWTRQSPDVQTKNEIDFILVNKNNICKDVTMLNKFHTGNDHRLVRAKIKINTNIEMRKLLTRH